VKELERTRDHLAPADGKDKPDVKKDDRTSKDLTALIEDVQHEPSDKPAAIGQWLCESS